MRKIRSIFYFLIFLLCFGRFLPAYNPPIVVSEFFGSGTIFFVCVFILFCLLFWRILKALHLSRMSWSENKRFLFNSIAVFILFASLVALVPVLQNLQNKFVIWANQDREISNLINPTLGMTMYKFPAEENSVEEVKFVSFEYFYNGCWFALVYTPNGIEKSRWNEYGDVERYNNQWGWMKSDLLTINKKDGHFTIH